MMRRACLLVAALCSCGRAFDLCDVPDCHCDRVTHSIHCVRVMFEALPIVPSRFTLVSLDNCRLTALGEHAVRGGFHLQSLSIRSAGLEYIDPSAFDGLSSLVSLHLSDNNIKHVPETIFGSLPALQVLNLSRNAISDLGQFDVDGRLLAIDLSHNRLRFARASMHMPPVAHLNLSANTGLSMANGSGLLFEPSSLCPSNRSSCRFLPLRSDNFNALKSLDISQCGALLETSFLAALSNIVDLSLAGNRVDDAALFSVLTAMTALRSLNMSRLTSSFSLNALPTFQSSLHRLDVSHMRLRTLNLPQTDTRSRSELVELTATNNQLASVSFRRSMPYLTSANFCHNRLTEVPVASEQLAQLRRLDLSFNFIGILRPRALHHFPRLQHLDLSHNHLVTLSAAALVSPTSKLESVDLSHNRLTSLPPMIVPLLRELRLTDNDVSTLPVIFFTGTPSLRLLDLSRNKKLFARARPKYDSQLTSFEGYPLWLAGLASLAELQWLALADTAVVALPSAVFLGWPHLRALDLSANLVDSRTLDGWLAAADFPVCLSRVDLSHNRLSTVGALCDDLRRSECISQVDLSRNPLVCDCTLAPLKALVESDDVSVAHWNNDSLNYCYSPDTHWRYPLRGFIENVMPCELQRNDPIFVVKLAQCFFVGCSLAAILGIACKFCPEWIKKRRPHMMNYVYRPLGQRSTSQCSV